MSATFSSQTVIAAIEAFAPPKAAASWDRSGVQIAGQSQTIRSLAVCLDPTAANIRRALSGGADFILAHHPLSMSPQYLDTPSPYHETAAAVLSAGAWLYSAHTSLDANPQGPSAWLADELGLSERRVVESTLRVQPATFCILTESGPNPEWLSLPGLLAARTLGTTLVLTCAAADWPMIRAKILDSSPAGRQPACFQAEPEAPPQEFGFGLTGILPKAMPFDEFRRRIQALIRPALLSLCGQEPDRVHTIAVCGGSGAPLAAAAFAAGAQVLVTGDVKYHAALEATGCILDVGHFGLEEEMMRRLAGLLEKSLPGLPVFFLSGAEPFAPACSAYSQPAP